MLRHTREARGNQIGYWPCTDVRGVVGLSVWSWMAWRCVRDRRCVMSVIIAFKVSDVTGRLCVVASGEREIASERISHGPMDSDGVRGRRRARDGGGGGLLIYPIIMFNITSSRRAAPSPPSASPSPSSLPTHHCHHFIHRGPWRWQSHNIAACKR